MLMSQIESAQKTTASYSETTKPDLFYETKAMKKNQK